MYLRGKEKSLDVWQHVSRNTSAVLIQKQWYKTEVLFSDFGRHAQSLLQMGDDCLNADLYMMSAKFGIVDG